VTSQGVSQPPDVLLGKLLAPSAMRQLGSKNSDCSSSCERASCLSAPLQSFLIAGLQRHIQSTHFLL
jgi:hypothetical protein